MADCLFLESTQDSTDVYHKSSAMGFPANVPVDIITSS
ncbi:hypothetical protein BVRB_8g186880 [Beta vulgaris subsp. vulgaris]|nr:hypothetical protein BVRB_8g186880 [Beta vulgaris subsp. vulgaris]